MYIVFMDTVLLLCYRHYIIDIEFECTCYVVE